MIDVISAVSRLLALSGAAWIIGSTVFHHWCVPPQWRRAESPGRAPLLVMAVLVAVGHAGMMATQAYSLAQLGSGPLDLRSLLAGTHVGQVWSIRALFSLLLLLAVMLAPAGRRFPHGHWAYAVLAALYLSSGPWGGHAAGAEPVWQVLPPNIMHVLALSVWLGALPSWWQAVRNYAGQGASALPTPGLAATLQCFSRLSMVLMLVIIGTGWWLADLYIEHEGDLLGTRYGLLVVAKVGLLTVVLLMANRLRTRFLPDLTSQIEDASLRHRATLASRYVGIEICAALGVMFCGAWLAQTTPAMHEIAPAWWLPFRWSTEATWPDPILRNWIIGGALAALLGAAAVWRGGSTPARVVGAIAALAGAGVLSWALAVEAYPGTYFRSQVPYLTLSVASGRTLYAEHCTSCHGSGGLGDGPLAARLPKPPANLSEPHTALHTAGDMHWWLTNGIPESGMPPLGQVLTEEDRWDLINFLRAFSQGFEARVMRAGIVPGQAWLGAINFYIEGAPGPTELKGYRETHNVLLAFLGAGGGAERALALARSEPEFRARRTQVLVVPLGGAALPSSLPYPVLRSGADNIWAAYELLSRTVGDRGLPDRLGMEWTHAEFLIDRFGYVRARWIPQDDPSGWSDPAKLYLDLERLNAEQRLRPPPDDHIH